MTGYITEKEWDHLDEENRQKIASVVAADNRLRTIEQRKRITLRNSFYVRYVKRMIDIVLAGIAFIFFIPVNLILAVITFFDVGRPILFKQQRIGKDGKLFTLIKFRNMNNATNEEGILLQPEERITKWGRFVRETSLDELLNFWSVLKGDMSIIGPRPLPKKYMNRFSIYHQQRHLVRPGLECPFHDSKVTVNHGWQERLDNDVWYVENISFATDVKLFFGLLKKVFSKNERLISASGKMGEFIGYHEDGRVMTQWEIPRKYIKLAGKK